MLHPTFHFDYPYFLSDILLVSYVLSCAEPAASDRRIAYTAGADAARRQNGFGIPLRASARGVLYSARNRGSSSFWEPASCADGLTARNSADQYTRSPLRPGRRPEAFYSLLISDCIAFRTSCLGLTVAPSTAESQEAQIGQTRLACATFRLEGKVAKIRKSFPL